MADVSIEGRKIVLVAPPGWVREEIMPALVSREYKVFYLDDHRFLGKVMQTYPGSLIFLNQDKALTGTDWNKVIEGFGEIRDSTGSIVKPVRMEEDKKSVTKNIYTEIEANQARGRRRFARTRCSEIGDAKLSIRRDRDFYNGVVLDLSSAGFACQIPSLEDFLSLRMSVDDVQLTLANSRVRAQATVAAVRPGTPKTFVMLFASKLPQADREKVFTYIRKTSQRIFERSLMG